MSALSVLTRPLVRLTLFCCLLALLVVGALATGFAHLQPTQGVMPHVVAAICRYCK